MSGSMTRLLAQLDEQAPDLLAAHKVPGIGIGIIDGGLDSAGARRGHRDVGQRRRRQRGWQTLMRAWPAQVFADD